MTITIPAKGFTDGIGDDYNGANAVAISLKLLTGTNTDPVVPYLTLWLCEKVSSANASPIPRGLTAFFAAEHPPEGWELVLGAEERFIVGLPGGGEQGFSSGSAVGAAASHNHDSQATMDLNKNFNTDLSTDMQNWLLAKQGTIDVPCNCSETPVELPAFSALHCVYTGVL